MRALLAVAATMLIAGVCPFAPGTPQAAAAEGSIVELPAGFGAYKLNENGAVAGLVWQGGDTVPAIYKDGNLTVLPGGPANGISDFRDDGTVIATTMQGQITVRTTEDSRVLPQVVTDGNAKFMQYGFGPDASGRIIGTYYWDNSTETTAATYVGASPPELITDIATVMGVNKKGEVIGQLPGSPDRYGILSNGAVTPVSGIVEDFYYKVDFSNARHLLYGTESGLYLWANGASTLLPGYSASAVNDEGIVSMQDPVTQQSALRFPNGDIRLVADLAGGSAPLEELGSTADINNKCEVVGQGRKQVNGDTVYLSYLAHVPGCKAPAFDGAIFRSDLKAPSLMKDEETDVRMRVENVSGEDLTNVKITSMEATPVDEGAAATVVKAGADVPSNMPGSGPGTTAFVEYKATGTSPGKVRLTAKLSAMKGSEAVTGTIESEFTVRAEDLVVNLTLDPPEYEVPEDGEFEPTDITATVSFTNETDQEMTNLKLQDLDVSRVFSGQELYVTYKSGIRPDPLDPEVIVPSLAAGATSPEFQAIFTATDDGEVEFGAMATAKLGENGAATGVKKVRWKAKVRKFVEIKTTVSHPTDDDMLNAGGQIVIDGTVENLTNNFDVTLGPLWPTLVGNTGTMSLAYDGPAPNPTSPVPVEPLVLARGEKRTFQIRITTNYSEPAMKGAHLSGGTRANITFEPWGFADEVQDPNDPEIPEHVDIRTYDEAKPGNGAAPGETPDAQVKATPEDLFKYVSIDDSIEIPPSNPAGVAAGIMVGAVEGLANAAIATIYAIPDLIKMPYTFLVAAYDYQAKVWASFTEAEKEQFLTETSFMVVSVLQRNAELGLKDAEELYNLVYQQAGEYLTQSQNDWYTGDYMKTTRTYSAFLSEQVGSVAGPLILAKMAKAPAAVAALERWQVALNAKMAATFQAANNIKYVDNVLPILQSIENGAEPTLNAIAKLWGITPDEVAEYQRICRVIGCLATLRSRHASSVEWIKKWGALLKPENLKIKTVSELDVMLGYDVKDLGSLVFRKPEILKTLGAGASKDQIAAEAAKFATSKGFKAGTTQHDEAVQRLTDKVSEWNKYEKSYKQWDKRGWIDTSMNYEGNAIPEYKFGPNGEVTGHMTGGDKGSFRGFRLREKNPGSGDEEYIVEMLDGKSGKFRRVTGDIDPVDFTYTDGSPLSPEDHAKLIKMLQDSPIGAEHGYTSTFLGFKDPKTGAVIVDPGPELVKKQFKPNEAALQIGPDGPPRATRIDVANSRWKDPYDYNIRWVNGFVDAGTKRSRGIPEHLDAKVDVIPLDAPKQVALPVRSKPADPTVGRFVVKHANQGALAAVIMGENGRLQTIKADGTTEDSPLHDQAFSEGVGETITISPQSTLEAPDTPPDDVRSPAPDGGAAANSPPRSTVGASAPALVASVAARSIRLASASLDEGSTTIRVSTAAGLASGATGFEAGQVVAIGTGSDNLELRRIASVADGVLSLTEPLAHDHDPGEVVAMVVTAEGVPVDPTKGVDPKQTDDLGTDPGTDTPTTPTTPAATGGSNTGGSNTGGSNTGGSNTGGSNTGGSSTDTDADGSSESNTPSTLAWTGVSTLIVFLLGLVTTAVGFSLSAAPDRMRRFRRTGHNTR